MHDRLTACAFVLPDHVTGSDILDSAYAGIDPSDPAQAAALAPYLFASDAVRSRAGEFCPLASAVGRFPILVAGHAFGSGPSPANAPAALAAAGVRVILADSFADLFFRRLVNAGGLLPLILLSAPSTHEAATGRLCERITTGATLTVDLSLCCVTLPDGSTSAFEHPGVTRKIAAAGGLLRRDPPERPA